jgi:hypothetical protein
MCASFANKKKTERRRMPFFPLPFLIITFLFFKKTITLFSKFFFAKIYFQSSRYYGFPTLQISASDLLSKTPHSPSILIFFPFCALQSSNYSAQNLHFVKTNCMEWRIRYQACWTSIFLYQILARR